MPGTPVSALPDWSWLVIVGTAGTMILALLLSMPIGSLRANRPLRTADRRS